MNFFNKRTYNMIPSKSKLYDEEEFLLPQDGDVVDLKNAIDIRMEKQSHSDFFLKLLDLNDRIEVFNTIFLSR